MFGNLRKNLWPLNISVIQSHTQEEIAETVGVHKDTVSEICRKMADLPESDKPYANHLIDFEVPI